LEDRKINIMKKLKVIIIIAALTVTLAGCGSQVAAPVVDQEPPELYFIQQTDNDGNAFYEYDTNAGTYVLNGSIDDVRKKGGIVISADEIKSAEAGYNGSGDRREVVVNIQFNDAGTKLFAEATQRAMENGESIGIYYDGEFVSVPYVKASINDGAAVITGIENYEEAFNLAEKLNQ